MKAWCIRRNRGELRRDLGRGAFFFAGAVLGDFFLVVEAVDEAAGVEPGVWATTVAAHTNTPNSNANQKDLRNPTTSF